MKHLLTLALLVCLGTFASAQIPSYVPTNGLVGWWPFNGNANDESGNGNHGTVNGATLAADRFGNTGKAYSFDGSGDYLNIAYSSTISPIIGTVSGWLKTYSSIPQQSLIFGQSHGRPQLFVNNGKVYIGWGATQGFANCASITSVDNGQWVHVLGIFSTNSFSIYVNGVLESSNSTNLIQNSCNAPLQIGGFLVSTSCGTNGSNGQFFNGLLDDIAIYNRALSLAEVQQLYLGNSSNTAAATVPGKIHYQGLAVGANGKPIKSSTVGLRLSVLDSLPNGITLYTETQSVSTDAAGIFSTYLGGGTATAGTFANIPWANGNNKFLKVEMDAQGGTNYQNMGSTQLVSVPYALHAGSAQRASELVDSAGNAYQIKIVNGQPTLVSAPGNVSIPAPFACGQSVTYAGESYPTVQIGSQCWFQKNVNAGSMVLGANDQTNNGVLEKYCYDNDSANCAVFGGMYQWAEAVQYQNGASNTTSPSPAFTGNVKGICPTGWHVPSDGEWCTLTTFLDSTVNCNSIGWSGTGIGGKMRSVNGLWFTNVSSGAITNSSGFSAVPNGNRDNQGIFGGVGGNAFFSTASESSNFEVYNRSFYVPFPTIARNNHPKSSGIAVRCLKD